MSSAVPVYFFGAVSRNTPAKLTQSSSVKIISGYCRPTKATAEETVCCSDKNSGLAGSISRGPGIRV
ncbi:hypothetical protein NLM33_17725 [Bradyrhizobium sp. CCGUVB1N3]|uniref:hypothetical protein n=1 Tax=Bradyrhizobium sp. CCGUVB1N3 TaxID=2949629 RepID=UPI0020B18C7A|nr:hypothetical protein [Bradyrhizobium sp. CCGUVB1N3]MCP3472156.1 hypothetical protein [Bradyrhizobium sp. CCGUVB1N3]